MKLNADDFRKSLEQKKKQKKDTEISLMRMHQDLQAAIERRTAYLSNITSLVLDAALNGLSEVGLDIDDRTEYEDYLRNFGFEIESREVQSDSLLRKIRKLSSRELKALHSRLNSEISKIVKILPPEEDADLLSVYEELLNADEDVELQVKHLLKVLASYNIEYRENNYLSLEDDAKLWLHLSRLQDVVDLYDAENDTEESIQAFLLWEDDDIEANEVPDEQSSYSLLNPSKLRFINSKEGNRFFSKISEEINDTTDELKSFIQFDLIVSNNENEIFFSDEKLIRVPFGSNDLQKIFQKMGFNATAKPRAAKGQNVIAFKIKF
jgi:hypothetical protein